jgi:hypothetical protein
MRADAHVLPAASNKSYLASSRSKRSSRSPSPRTAWKRSSGSFVERDQHAIAVPPLPITPHTYPLPLQVVVGVSRSRRSEGHIETSEDVPRHSLGYELDRPGSGSHVAYDDVSSSSREVTSTPMTATKNNVPPSSTLVMTVLVLRTNPSRNLCTASSSR